MADDTLTCVGVLQSPVTVPEFEEAEARVKDGTYVYNVVEYQRFSVRNYKSWTGSLDKTQRF